ncbi:MULTISPECIES: hypothetical protein [Microbacterium]|uniref:hypothetical protein n=1 Tax=Microbacterium TaxID=33882 RepID=UPI0010CA54E6|nr:MULTISPECIES: hypothetical protein [Microbacterium]QCQ16102.1 hypothetical protein EHF32_04820 [Microbacterium sp. RG1]UIN32124.1 hypothetical protein LXM64_08075 [Microbacterium binotii]
MVMAHNKPRPPLRERVREAGGWYAWINRTLIRAAGPASVGPYETAPEPVRTERPCPLCGAPMSTHTFDRSGPKPIMHCP